LRHTGIYRGDSFSLGIALGAELHYFLNIAAMQKCRAAGSVLTVFADFLISMIDDFLRQWPPDVLSRARAFYLLLAISVEDFLAATASTGVLSRRVSPRDAKFNFMKLYVAGDAKTFRLFCDILMLIFSTPQQFQHTPYIAGRRVHSWTATLISRGRLTRHFGTLRD